MSFPPARITGKRIVVAVALALTCFTLLSPTGALGLPRAPGDYWVYAASAGYYGVNVTGNITYEFEREETVSVRGTQVPVNVMSVDGSLAGGTTFFITATYGATFHGVMYELREGWGFAGINETLWLNTSLGVAPAQSVTHSVVGAVVTFLPSLFSKFSPNETSPGDSWTESVEVNGTLTVVNGTAPPETQTMNDTFTFSISVDPALETVNAIAGKFNCLKLTATNTSGEKVVLWWSNKVGNFVMLKVFVADVSSTPLLTLELRDYANKKGAMSTVYLVIGVAAILVALVVLALVLLARRKRRPEEPPPQAEGPRPS